MSARRPLKLPLAIFLLLAGVYLLTTGGHIYASDEERLINVAESLLFHGSFALNAGTGEPPRYSIYGPGQSIAALPLVGVGHGLAALLPDAVAPWAVRLAVSWFNPLVTAATGALVALAALQLGYGPRPAAAVALIYGLATLAWPHSKTFFAEPLAAGLTFAAFVVMQKATYGRQKAKGKRQNGAALICGGLLAGLACAVKIQAGLALPLLGLWLIYEGKRQKAKGKSTPEMITARSLLSPFTFYLFPFTFGAIGALGLLGLYQWALFGSPLRSGYGGGGGVFANDLLKGLYGLLLSPGKGIIWYAPPLILLPVGLAGLWRRDRGVAALCAAIGVATLLLYAKVIFWHGDGAWGPRYLNMALPFLVLPLVGLWGQGDRGTGGQGDGDSQRNLPLSPSERSERVPWSASAASGPASERSERPGQRAQRAALPASAASGLLILCLLAVPVQLGGVLINLNAYLERQPSYPERYYVPSQSPIAGQLRMVGENLAAGYRLRLAPGSLALAEGFSYSEGDRERGEQLPRWTLPEATIALRPPGGQGAVVELALSGCRPAPVAPATVTLAVDGRAVGDIGACPPRRVRLLLPAAPTAIRLSTDGWRPADAGIAREGPLGLFLIDAQAHVGEAPLALQGALVPIAPMPTSTSEWRAWANDYRYGHWDLWWWYAAHAGLPGGTFWALVILWGGAAAGLIGAGGAALRRCLRA